MNNAEIKIGIKNNLISKEAIAYKSAVFSKSNIDEPELKYYLRNGMKNLTRIIDLEDVLENISKYPLIKNEEGKYSAKLSKEQLPDYEQNLITVFAYAKREDFTPNNLPLENKLIPLWMYAHKHYNNVAYEDWSKKGIDEPWLNLSKELYDGMKKTKPHLKELMAASKRVRDYILENGNRLDKASASPSFGSACGKLKIKIGNGKDEAGNKLTMNILAGVGLAYAGKSDYRILNLMNFDKLGEFPEEIVMDNVILGRVLY